LLQVRRDAPALEEDRAARDLGRVRREDGDDLDARQEFERLFARRPRAAHAAERAAESPLLRLRADHLGRPAPALAVVRLGEVGQLEVDGEGFGQAVSRGEVQARDPAGGALKQLAGALVRAVARLVTRCVAVLYGEQAQLFDGVEKSGAALLLQDFAEQPAEDTHVAAQRRFLQLRVVGNQLRQPRRLVFRTPQRFLFSHLLATSRP
jgi:hypothetical protein